MNANLHSNIRALKLSMSLKEMLVLAPVITLYAASKGINISQFMQIQTIFMAVLIAVSPFASGWADRTGYKRAILTGMALWTTGHATIWQSTGFWSFTLGEVQFAVAVALTYPAAGALQFLSLKATGHQSLHHQVMNNQNSSANIATAMAMGLGGVLYAYHTQAAAIATVVVMGIALAVAALTLKDIPNGTDHQRPTLKETWRGAWEDLSHRETRWVVILPGLVSGSTILLFWAFQPKLGNAGVAAATIGWLMMASFLLRAGYAKAAPWVQGKLGTRKTLMLSTSLLIMGVLSMGLLPWWWALPGYSLGSSASYVLATSLGKDLLQHKVEGPHRATAMAGFAMVERLMGIISLNTAALLLPWVGLENTLLITGGMFSLAALMSLKNL